jgi:hypothetical protein
VEITNAGRGAPAAAKVVIDRRLEEMWCQHITDQEARTIVEVMERVLAASPPGKTAAG